MCFVHTIVTIVIKLNKKKGGSKKHQLIKLQTSLLSFEEFRNQKSERFKSKEKNEKNKKQIKMKKIQGKIESSVKK